MVFCFSQFEKQTKAKLPKPDRKIILRRKDDKQRERLIEMTKYYQQSDIKSAFEAKTTSGINSNKIKKRFEDLKEKECEKLQQRRERLRILLDNELHQFKEEHSNNVESNEQRLTKMREQVATIRAEREQEHQRIVEEKLRQHWRNNCDDLRFVESKMVRLALAESHELQKMEKREKDIENKEKEKYYADLWEKDRLSKTNDEEIRMKHQKDLNYNMVQVLNWQMEELRKKQEEQRLLKEEEGRILKEKNDLRKLEDERAFYLNRRKKLEFRRLLDNFTRIKAMQHTKELEEENELNRAILTEYFRLSNEDESTKSKKKENLRKDIEEYLEYLEGFKQQEKERKRQLEILYERQGEEVWKKRIAQWRKEQEARDKLMEFCIEERNKQIRYKYEQNLLEREQLQYERNELEKLVEEGKRKEMETQLKKKAIQQEYKDSLMEQMHEMEEKNAENKKLKEMMDQQEKVAECCYRLLVDTLGLTETIKDDELEYNKILHQEMEESLKSKSQLYGDYKRRVYY